jgi:intracellular septation protein
MKNKSLIILLKVVNEFLPILVFIVVFENYNFFIATYAMILAVFASILISFSVDRSIPYFSIFVSIITVIFAVITVITKNKEVLVLRDSVYDFFFASIILGGLVQDKLVLRKYFSHIVDMRREAWVKISYVWAFYFIFTGTTNEYIRNMDTVNYINYWVYFKVLVICITTLLGIWTWYYAEKHIKETA